MAYPLPSNEDERLRVLHDLAILDTPSDPVLDEICRSAARRFEAASAMVTLVDSDRQWFKARYGLDVCETPRDQSFCTYVVADDGVLIVPDAREDVRFQSNPLVVGPPYIRFYAGAPLYYGKDIRLGALCIIDQRPRVADAIDAAELRMLADRVAGEIWVTCFEREPAGQDHRAEVGF